MSKTLTLNNDNFESEVLQSDIPVVVDFWATWCGPCRAIAPVLDELAAEYEGRVKIGKVNVDENRALAGQYRVMSIPTLLFIKDGKVVNQQVGAMGRDQLASVIDGLM
ncbi:MAG: thioredoxin [Acidobacteria bacterium]|nr:MAG: thioredoxin [Acidobacteriota bacterium]PIE90906.1 MAG: thioredoxin [Acidobacteriota bacterium]